MGPSSGTGTSRALGVNVRSESRWRITAGQTERTDFGRFSTQSPSTFDRGTDWSEGLVNTVVIEALIA